MNPPEIRIDPNLCCGCPTLIYTGTKDEQTDQPLYRTQYPVIVGVWLPERHFIIHIPRGFPTDLASLPKLLRAIYDSAAPETELPALTHDYLYSCAGYISPQIRLERRHADEMLRQLMIANGCSRLRARLYWIAVRAFGGSHWAK